MFTLMSDHVVLYHVYEALAHYSDRHICFIYFQWFLKPCICNQGTMGNDVISMSYSLLQVAVALWLSCTVHHIFQSLAPYLPFQKRELKNDLHRWSWCLSCFMGQKNAADSHVLKYYRLCGQKGQRTALMFPVAFYFHNRVELWENWQHCCLSDLE